MATVQALLQKGKFLIAHHQDELVGCVYVEPTQERAYLGLLAVDPQHQGLDLVARSDEPRILDARRREHDCFRGEFE